MKKLLLAVAALTFAAHPIALACDSHSSYEDYSYDPTYDDWEIWYEHDDILYHDFAMVELCYAEPDAELCISFYEEDDDVEFEFEHSETIELPNPCDPLISWIVDPCYTNSW